MKEKNFEIEANTVSFPPFPIQRIWSFQELKTLWKGQFLMLPLSYWYMAKCFQWFVCDSRSVKGGVTGTRVKKVIFRLKSLCNRAFSRGYNLGP